MFQNRLAAPPRPVTMPLFGGEPPLARALHNATELLCSWMTNAQLKRYLAKLGRTFEPGAGGHLRVIVGDRTFRSPDAWQRQGTEEGDGRGDQEATGIEVATLRGNRHV